jgi:hypothetical protein
VPNRAIGDIVIADDARLARPHWRTHMGVSPKQIIFHQYLDITDLLQS